MKKETLKKKIKYILLFGNPVKHSLSPVIHKNFSKEIKINYNYSTFSCKKSNFFKNVIEFLNSGGHGCNITVPFKKDAFNIPDQYSEKAYISGSINTLVKIEDNNFLGDNTDGIGLIYDLKRLKYLKKKNTVVLLLGSGGVAYSIVYHLLKEKCCIFVLNRTMINSIRLVKKFKCFGKIFIFSDYLYENHFDIIINATSCGLSHQSPFFPKKLIFPHTKCYDISYSKKNVLTPFLSFCKYLGSQYYSDGLGMLVAQAAYSCYLWFNILPDIKKNIDILSSTL
ncbi:Shikimate dehydrogenase (NADP(+)) [Buchnera aphidicola (Cinara piceae)]|uniref:Shikimate dehydrogenase (NADP(+)) n=1 Tax=Buchnera aphidicola (Cinara piceae) TaxID=1660043 RepID=A0A803GD80_9GAMM|nr:shikimate dehydrogenase [Buchnera aphidicola]VFP88648.1 Shikimate dehydrogenase (NADP(+)) [Buchnera aphidicola (Cinara piceae)]